MQILKQINSLNALLESKSKAKEEELEKALFESEKALMAQEFYIQKSRLYTKEEKRQNYIEMIEVRIDTLLNKIVWVCFYENDALNNNAEMLNEEFFYREDAKWVEENSKSIDACYDVLYKDDSDESVINFYETHLIECLKLVEFKDGSQKEAFYLRLENKLYLKLVSDVNVLKEKIYKGF